MSQISAFVGVHQWVRRRRCERASCACAPLARHEDDRPRAGRKRARASRVCVIVLVACAIIHDAVTECPRVTSARVASRTEQRRRRREARTFRGVCCPCSSRNARWRMRARPNVLDTKFLMRFEGCCSASLGHEAFLRGARWVSACGLASRPRHALGAAHASALRPLQDSVQGLAEGRHGARRRSWRRLEGSRFGGRL